MDAAETWQAVLQQDARTAAHYESRVRGRRVQLENVDRAAPKPASEMLARQVRRAEGRARRAAHMAQRRTPRHAHTVRPNQVSYAQAEPLHALWTTYAQELLGLPELGADEKALRSALTNTSHVQNMQNTLLKADWIGAHVEVVQSTNPTLVHLAGIIVQETHEALHIVVRGDARVRLVPKQNSVFRMEIAASDAADAPRLRLDLYGNQLRYTLPARATRKHKARKTIELDRTAAG